MKWNMNQLIAVRDQHEDWLIQQAGVTGTAIGEDADGRLSIKILTNQVRASERERIRAKLGGTPVCFEETGSITAS